MSEGLKIVVGEVRPQCADQIVEILEKLLEEAKAGQIRAFGYVCRKGNGDSLFGWKVENNADAISLVGVSEWMKAELLEGIREVGADG